MNKFKHPFTSVILYDPQHQIVPFFHNFTLFRFHPFDFSRIHFRQLQLKTLRDLLYTINTTAPCFLFFSSTPLNSDEGSSNSLSIRWNFPCVRFCPIVVCSEVVKLMTSQNAQREQAQKTLFPWPWWFPVRWDTPLKNVRQVLWVSSAVNGSCHDGSAACVILHHISPYPGRCNFIRDLWPI